MRTSARQRSTTSTGASTSTPQAASTSALPLREETLRLPCLATVTPAAGDHQGRGGGDVEGPRAVAAGATGVEHHATGRRADRRRAAAHDHGRGGDLRRRLALHPQRHQEGAHLRRGGLSLEDGLEGGLDLGGREVDAGRPASGARPSWTEPSLEEVPRAGSARRGVRTLSGWNWTPTVGCVRCRSAMISPSSAESAVTSRTSGMRGAVHHQRVVAADRDRRAADRRRGPCPRATRATSFRAPRGRRAGRRRRTLRRWTGGRDRRRGWAASR